MRALIGVAPIAWSNDDLPELGGATSLETCLSEARGAGYAGVETGGKFPREPDVLGPILRAHDLALCGGWYSGTLLDNDIEREKERVGEQLALFTALGAPVLVYGETARSIQGERHTPLARRVRLDEAEIASYARRMTELAEWCAAEGTPIVYHHHMAAVIETERDLDHLVNHSGEALGLLYDPGHMAFAGGDVTAVLERHARRIRHVHAKDVRAPVIAGLDRERESFLDAVLKGAFTVPGDGSLDFAELTRRLADSGYEGWFVVEAEQDPSAAPPAAYAALGYREMSRCLEAAGYDIMERA